MVATGKTFEDLEIDEELKKGIEEHTEDYVCVGFTLNRALMKPVLKSEVKPQDLYDIGDYLSTKWKEEVIDKTNELMIKFAEENGLIPIGQIDIVGTSTVASALSQNEMITMGAKISGMRGGQPD